MRELVVISGKGGTGKTSITASFAVLARPAVVADCDVDAADLHLVLSPEVQRTERFRAGREAVIRPDACTGCGTCRERCRFEAVRAGTGPNGATWFAVDSLACEGCGVCVHACPAHAIDFPERDCGEWFVSGTRAGPMVHARLGVAAENSGKLVTLVRRQAKEIAERDGLDLVLVDGPPGIGCPVIASLTGATGVLAVTEPTVSGEHDLERVLAVARHFGIPVAVCVNKWDLNPGMAERIERLAAGRGARIAGRVRYDPAVTAAQIRARTVVEVGGGAARDIRALWSAVGCAAGGVDAPG
jgi:MinD superfamily P-loop ATPase